MAEETAYGQLSRADAILEEIRDSSLAQEAQLIRQWETTNLQNKMTLDMASADDIEREYGQQQQGQEVAYSRWSQLHQEKTKEMMEDDKKMTDKGDGPSTEATQQEATEYLSELKEKATLSLKAQTQRGFDQTKQWLENKAQFSNFYGTFKNDINLITGGMQFLTKIPGITTLLGAIKWILSSLALFFLKRFPKIFDAILWVYNQIRKMGGKEEVDNILGMKKKDKPADPLVEDPGEIGENWSQMRIKQHKAQKDAFDAQQEAIQESEGYWGGFKDTMANMKKKLFKSKPDKEVTKSFETMKEGYEDQAKQRSQMSKGFSKMGESFKGWLKEVNESGGMFKYLGGMLKKAGKSLMTSVKTMLGPAITSLIGAIFGASFALFGLTIPIWAVVAAVLLIGIGLYMFWDEIQVGWENLKKAFKRGIEKVKSWGPRIKNFFTDAGEDYLYVWKWLLAKLKDGILSMANWVIDKVNKILPKGWEIDKFDTGNAERLTKERTIQLRGRSERDALLDGVKKDLDASVDKTELEKFRQTKEASGVVGSPVVTTVNNNQTSRSHFTGSPEPRDQVLRAQNKVR